jgi:hypothetical protein
MIGKDYNKRVCGKLLVVETTVIDVGNGHFSPVGGYHPELDLVLILDVARHFKNFVKLTRNVTLNN